PAAAARLLARRAPPGAVAALVAFAPHADDDSVEEAVRAALLSLSPPDKEPDPALGAALRDAAPARRAAAAHVLGRHADASRRAAVLPLRADRDPGVRFLAARALLLGREGRAVPALASLLDEAPLALAWQAEELLFRLAGARAPGVSLGPSPAERARARAAWEAWWHKHGAGTDLARLAGG